MWEFRKLIFDVLFEEFLHATNPPESTSQDDVTTDSIEAVRRQLFEDREEGVCDIRLLILGIAKEHIEVDLISDELHSDLANVDANKGVGCSDIAIGATDFIELFLCDAPKEVHRDLLIE